MNEKVRFSKLFWSVFKISACTFGGGFVIIPLIQKKFVNDLHWIEEDEMMDLAAIAQSAPGAIGVNISIIVGYHVAGIPGALVAAAGAVCPPLIIISIISMFYQAFRDNVIVNLVMKGMLAGVAAVILDVVIDMILKLGKGKKNRILPFLVMIAAFIATRYLKVNIIIIILVCGVIGAVETLKAGKYEKTGNNSRNAVSTDNTAGENGGGKS